MVGWGARESERIGNSRQNKGMSYGGNKSGHTKQIGSENRRRRGNDQRRGMRGGAHATSACACVLLVGVASNTTLLTSHSTQTCLFPNPAAGNSNGTSVTVTHSSRRRKLALLPTTSIQTNTHAEKQQTTTYNSRNSATAPA